MWCLKEIFTIETLNILGQHIGLGKGLRKYTTKHMNTTIYFMMVIQAIDSSHKQCSFGGTLKLSLSYSE